MTTIEIHSVFRTIFSHCDEFNDKLKHVRSEMLEMQKNAVQQVLKQAENSANKEPMNVVPMNSSYLRMNQSTVPVIQRTLDVIVICASKIGIRTSNCYTLNSN